MVLVVLYYVLPLDRPWDSDTANRLLIGVAAFVGLMVWQGQDDRWLALPGSRAAEALVAFQVIGTAVRAKGCPPLPRPFTTELSGPDFAKLLMDGWVPAEIAWASRWPGCTTT